MPELSFNSLVRKGRAGKVAMFLLAFALALDLLQSSLAGTDDPRQESPREIRGLVIFKIPFGTTKRNKLIPELGLDLSVNKPEDELYKEERFDLRTGAKLPEYDMESIRTWSLEDLEQPPVADPGQSARREAPAGPKGRIKGLSEYGVLGACPANEACFAPRP